MTLFAAAEAASPAPLYLELGLAVLALALLTRAAHWLRVSSIPFFLLGGLAFGNGGLLALDFSESFVSAGSEIGIVLLLLMLGLEYSGEQLAEGLHKGFRAGALDLALNFAPGFVAGLLLGYGWLPAVLLGGVTAISSSGIVAKLVPELNAKGRPETPTVYSILVLEDLAMAVYLPVVAVLLIGQGWREAAPSVAVAVGAVAAVLVIALRFGHRISSWIDHESDDAVLLTTLGLTLAVAGLAQRLQVSAAVGAFLVGVALSGSLAERSHRLLVPLRDLFSAMFFLFFGLQIDPKSLLPVLYPALLLALVSAATKVVAGYWAVRRAGGDKSARWRAGVLLIARGEFSIVIAGLGGAAEPRLGPLAAAYVLLLAILGPVLARVTEQLAPHRAKDEGDGMTNETERQMKAR